MFDTSVLELWPTIVAGGFVVGFLVGMTGVGAGSLMTPFLITQIGIAPTLAVGTDLLFASLTKASAALPHHNFGNVNWKIVRWLAAGSIPGSIATLALLTYFNPDTALLAKTIKQALVAALVVSSTAIVLYPFIVGHNPVQKDEKDAAPVRGPATLLLGLFAYALRPERPAADQTSALVTASPTPAPEAPMNAPPAPELVKQASPPKLMAVKAMHRAPHARIERYLVESEIATDFLPLTENAPPPNPAGLQTVRVEVPRLMLTRFGLPVNFERVTEPVKADLLIGPDGQTRAIRFVQTDFETPQIISASTNKER